MRRKDEQLRRYLRGLKHHRSRDEQKEIERASRARKAERSDRKRRERADWAEVEEDSLVAFEKIGRAPRPAPAATPVAPRDPARAGPAAARLQEALVTWVGQGRVRVLVGSEERDAVLGEDLARTQQTSVAVGDRVGFEPRLAGLPRVRVVHPRRSRLSRPDPAHPARERVIAANVDLAAVVVAVRRPAFRPRLIDRYRIALERGGVRPLVCASKVDLLEGPVARAEVERELDAYRAVGVPCLLVSSATSEGLDELRRALAGRTAVFVGQSGVGKSSLLNALDPRHGLEVGRVRAGDGKGRHTTSASRMLMAEDGTRVIDTPGVRVFGLDVDRRDLPAYFPELASVGPCHFSDCLHADEPDCAVRAAAEAGRISRARYESYLRLQASLEERT